METVPMYSHEASSAQISVSLYFQTCVSITSVMYKFLLIFPCQLPPQKKEKTAWTKISPLGTPPLLSSSGTMPTNTSSKNPRLLNPMVRSTQKRSLTRHMSSSLPANVQMLRRLTGLHHVKI